MGLEPSTMNQPKTWERGDWFISYSGRPLEVLRPTPDDILLVDIAHHLSMVCRFGGAVRRFYSVADHSIYVSRLVETPGALLHDATEAYLGDVIKPIKNQLGAAYADLEKLWEAAIATRFGLPPDFSSDPAVKRADVQAVQAERRDLLVGGGPWSVDADRFPPSVAPCVPSVDPESAFLLRALELGIS